MAEPLLGALPGDLSGAGGKGREEIDEGSEQRRSKGTCEQRRVKGLCVCKDRD